MSSAQFHITNASKEFLFFSPNITACNEISYLSDPGVLFPCFPENLETQAPRWFCWDRFITRSFIHFNFWVL